MGSKCSLVTDRDAIASEKLGYLRKNMAIHPDEDSEWTIITSRIIFNTYTKEKRSPGSGGRRLSNFSQLRL